MKTLSIFISILVGTTCTFANPVEDSDIPVDIERNKTEEKQDSHKFVSIEEREKLFNHLFHKNYDKNNYPANITVKFVIAVRSLDIDEYKSTLELDVWLRMVWIDSRFIWDEKDFPVDVIRVSSNLIWVPDITLYNSANYYDDKQMQCWNPFVLIYPTGEVLWVPPCHLSAFCNLTLSEEPYGPQHCHLKFGSWTFDGISMGLKLYNNAPQADMGDYIGVARWQVTSNEAVLHNKTYSCCSEHYPDIVYNFTLQKKPIKHSDSCSL